MTKTFKNGGRMGRLEKMEMTEEIQEKDLLATPISREEEQELLSTLSATDPQDPDALRGALGFVGPLEGRKVRSSPAAQKEPMTLWQTPNYAVKISVE